MLKKRGKDERNQEATFNIQRSELSELCATEDLDNIPRQLIEEEARTILREKPEGVGILAEQEELHKLSQESLDSKETVTGALKAIPTTAVNIINVTSTSVAARDIRHLFMDKVRVPSVIGIYRIVSIPEFYVTRLTTNLQDFCKSMADGHNVIKPEEYGICANVQHLGPVPANALSYTGIHQGANQNPWRICLSCMKKGVSGHRTIGAMLTSQVYRNKDRVRYLWEREHRGNKIKQFKLGQLQKPHNITSEHEDALSQFEELEEPERSTKEEETVPETGEPVESEEEVESSPLPSGSEADPGCTGC